MAIFLIFFSLGSLRTENHLLFWRNTVNQYQHQWNKNELVIWKNQNNPILSLFLSLSLTHFLYTGASLKLFSNSMVGIRYTNFLLNRNDSNRRKKNEKFSLIFPKHEFLTWERMFIVTYGFIIIIYTLPNWR